ncbi:hypothetical protein AMTRI_Chr10g6320 [Amborella trichopoda]
MKIERGRLRYLANNQDKLRVEMYKGLLDAVLHGEFEHRPAIKIPRCHDYHKKFGKPDLYMTMTCNPQWREIKQLLNNNNPTFNQPGLIIRKLQHCRMETFQFIKVPYNPNLLLKHSCRINIEVCSTIKVIKEFRDARWVSPPEAAWRIFGFDLNYMIPSVYHLPLHLPNEQSIHFNKDRSLYNILADPNMYKMKLIMFFEANMYFIT